MSNKRWRAGRERKGWGDHMDTEQTLASLRIVDSEHVFSDIVETLVEQVRADVVWLQYVSSRGEIRLLQSHDLFDSPPLEWPRSACRTALKVDGVVIETNYNMSGIVPTKTPLVLSRLLCTPLELHDGRIVVSVGWYRDYEIAPHDRRIIELCTKLGGIAMENQVRYEKLTSSYHGMIRGLLSALEMRDFETVAHSRRVVTYTILLAEKLGVDVGLYDEFALGAALHDVGKIAISDAILRKPGRLTKVEFALVQQHPVLGYDLLRSSLAPFPIALEMVRHHHERYDGAGYPDRLAGREIPFAARLLALVDAFDVMTNARPYQGARSIEEAREEVGAHRGTQFCPECVDAFLSIDSSTLAAVRRGELDRSRIFDMFL